MPSLPAPEVAQLLREFGQRTVLRGGNPYRAKAYARAAENLVALTEPLEDLIAQDRLKEIPGVGDKSPFPGFCALLKIAGAGQRKVVAYGSQPAGRRQIPISAINHESRRS